MIERVLLARHGQTEWNLQGRRQGQLDSPLTEQGFEQARRNAELLHSVDTVFTSPLGRAVSTAKIFADQLGAEVVVIDELAELHHGRFAGLTNSEIEQQHYDEWHRRAQDKYRWRFPDGESYADVDQRAATALTLIDSHAANRPLIVSHEMIGRMLLRHLLNLDPGDALRRHHPHNVIYEVTPRTASVHELLSSNPVHDGPTSTP